MACTCEFPVEVPVLKRGYSSVDSREAGHYCGNCGEPIGQATHIGSRAKHKENRKNNPKYSEYTRQHPAPMDLHAGDCFKLIADNSLNQYYHAKDTHKRTRWWWYTNETHEYLKYRTSWNPWTKKEETVGVGKCIHCEKLVPGRIYHVEQNRRWSRSGIMLISEYGRPNKKYFEVDTANLTYEKLPEFWNWKTA